MTSKQVNRGTAESLCTAKQWFGHGAGRSPCAHSIGKFFLCYIISSFFFWNFRPRLARELLVYIYILFYIDFSFKTCLFRNDWLFQCSFVLVLLSFACMIVLLLHMEGVVVVWVFDCSLPGGDVCASTAFSIFGCAFGFAIYWLWKRFDRFLFPLFRHMIFMFIAVWP